MSTATEFVIKDPYHSNRQGAFIWILSHLRRHWLLFIGMLVGAFSNAALAAVAPMLIGRAFNALLATPPQLDILLTLAVGTALSQIIRGGFQLGRNFCAELIAQRMERDIRDELYASLLGKSMTFHSLQPIGDTMARATNDIREINLMFSPGINLVFGSANFLIMPILFAPQYNPSLILTPIVYVILYFLAIWQYLHELSAVSEEVRESFGVLNIRLTEAIDGVETVKGTSQELYEVKRFEESNRHFRDMYVRQGSIEARYIPLLLLGLAQAVGFFHALILFQQHILNIGQVISYFGLLLMFGFPTFVSLFAYSQISLGIAGAKRILELMNRQTDLDQNPSGYGHPLRGKIEFRNVSFSHAAYLGNSQRPILKNISFTVEPGQTVAIVGQTGSGKSALVKLINRTYDTTGGQVLVDDIDVRDWNLEELRRQISIIEQDIFLFSRPVYHNISFGKPDSTPDEIEAVAKAAQAHDFITEFKEGYYTVVGDRGMTLSGGQRQRIALARAFLTHPGILILDDSTSAIDSATEDKIQRAIYAASQGQTTIIITHRLSQIRWADLILVLRNGELDAIGNHQFLMDNSQSYRHLFEERESSE